MSARLKLSNIGEIKILGNQEPIVRDRRMENFGVGGSAQSFLNYGISIMPQLNQFRRQGRWEVLIKLDPHATSGISGSGRSS